MRLWPFGKNKGSEKVALDEGPSTMERLLSKNCTRDEFVLLMVKLFQEAVPDARLEMRDEFEVKVTRTGVEESTWFLNNAWLGYSRSEEGRKELIERHLRAALRLGEEMEELSRDRVVAMIKDAEYMKMFKPEHDPMTQHLCGDLWVVYAEDFPESMRSLKRSQVEAAGISEAEIRELAKDNLRRLMPSPEVYGEGPSYMMAAGGDYTASLLLFDGIWEDLAESVAGELVVVAPSRDVLLFTGAESPEGIRTIREKAVEIVNGGSYVISDTLVVRRNGRWEVFNAN